MTNVPLTSRNLSNILIFGMLLLPSIFLLAGVVPALLLQFGIVMMKREGSFTHVETAVANFKGYTCWAAVIGIVSAIYCFAENLTRSRGVYESFFDDEVIISLLAAIASVGYWVIVDRLFLKPLREHEQWVFKNGIFSRSISSVRKQRIEIIRREKRKSFSTADELLKWNKLKDDGLVSEDEFNEARLKIMGMP